MIRILEVLARKNKSNVALDQPLLALDQGSSALRILLPSQAVGSIKDFSLIHQEELK